MAGFSLIAALLISSGFGQTSPPPTNVRVAIVAYEDFHAEVEYFEHLFAKLSQQDPALRFKLALGSYGDVLHWIDRQLIDLAILTPGVFADLLPSDGRHEPRMCRYLATVQLPPARSKWASAQRRAEGFHDSYRSVCLISEPSTLQNVDDLRTAVRENRVEFLFVHPLSVSGRAAPKEALRQAGIEPTKEQVRFTYSHSQSIRMLNDALVPSRCRDSTRGETGGTASRQSRTRP